MARRPHGPGRRTTTVAALLAAGVAPAAIPREAVAHGLVERADLPIPEWLFAWAATGVMIVSFLALAAAWPRPRFEPPPWRPLPSWTGALLCSRAVTVAAGAIGIAMLATVVVAGYAGPDEAPDNFAPTFVMIVFWVGLAFASAILGDVFRALNPWRALGRLAAWGTAAAARRAGRPPRPYPARLGRWPAAAGLLAFSWVELASGWAEQPDRLATAVGVYTALTLLAMAVYGVERWIACGEAFSVYFGLLARISMLDVRDGRLGLRPPLAGLAGVTAVPGTVAFVATMIGGVSFDGLSQGRAWQEVAVGINDALLGAGLSIESAIVVSSSVGLLACVGLVAGFYRLGAAGARAVSRGRTTEELSAAFVHALVPVALAYVAAHYLTYLLFEGQAIAYLASDPLGRGWDLFGSASASIDYTLIGQTTAWYLQAGFVVAGHVAGLALAHDRALVVFTRGRDAVRSQYWMLAVMVGFTTFALWLLAQSSA